MEPRHPLNSDGYFDYGKLPFDCFVIHYWDDERGAEEDQMQWDELARRWLDMTHFERKPYIWTAKSLKKASPAGPGFPTAEQISRILSPHQTWEERTMCPDKYHFTLLLRTCYHPELAEAWKTMKAAICTSDTIIGVDPECVLENEDLYGAFEAGDNWNRIVLRMPSIVDEIEPWQRETKDHMAPVEEASVKEQTHIFVVDEEALRGDFIKVKWLDIHGNCIWDNKLSTDMVEDFFGRQELGHGFDDMLCYGDPWMCEKGEFML
ncbi:hypothetical protein CkaCkLH20_04239 [Colletotrichum karsti]|uniref:Uncharacterized protein n=1 Tax=Colletotrichum karsti TaxID=1095194 RepID=A0A9P6IAI3_9PEZI|nr:uncharacterized protein CkaCkLH20_04239 [Colletotrichum karsti]KAF9878201.1 hypothetical protein CkaCkLH20_04239 [Colletotrichum karsti]